MAFDPYGLTSTPNNEEYGSLGRPDPPEVSLGPRVVSKMNDEREVIMANGEKQKIYGTSKFLLDQNGNRTLIAFEPKRDKAGNPLQATKEEKKDISHQAIAAARKTIERLEQDLKAINTVKPPPKFEAGGGRVNVEQSADGNFVVTGPGHEDDGSAQGAVFSGYVWQAGVRRAVSGAPNTYVKVPFDGSQPSYVASAVSGDADNEYYLVSQTFGDIHETRA